MINAAATACPPLPPPLLPLAWLPPSASSAAVSAAAASAAVAAVAGHREWRSRASAGERERILLSRACVCGVIESLYGTNFMACLMKENVSIRWMH